MLQTILLFSHLAVALLIIGLVLLQRGKGADAGSGFGAGASGTVFGARGTASFFSRATGVLATVFFMTSLALAWFAGQTSEPESLLDSLATPIGVGEESVSAPVSDTGGLPGVLGTTPVNEIPADNEAASEAPEVSDALPSEAETGGSAND